MSVGGRGGGARGQSCGTPATGPPPHPPSLPPSPPPGRAIPGEAICAAGALGVGAVALAGGGRAAERAVTATTLAALAAWARLQQAQRVADPLPA